jgi:maltose alpha-D-glucosyltransferase/alpha-amylase
VVCYALTIEPDRPAFFNPIYRKNCTLTEVRRLIALRLEHEPLQSNADIKFLSGHEKGAPLVYLRSGVSGKILCAFNPSPKAATVKTPALSPQATLYHQGDAATLSGGILSLPAGSATFIQVD